MNGLPKGDAKLAAFVTALAERELNRQRIVHGDWFMNLAFGAGKHWVSYNSETGVVSEMPRIKVWQVRIVLNNFPRLQWAIAAQLIRNRPQPQAVPMSSSEGDRMAARGWQHYFDFVWESQQVRRLLRDEMIPWTFYAGVGWLRVTWNADAGPVRTLALPRDPSPEDEPEDVEEPDENAGKTPEGDDIAEMLGVTEPLLPPEPEVEDQDIPAGEIEFSAPSPFNVFMDPSAVNIRAAKWVLELSWVSRKAAEETYHKKLVGGGAVSGSTYTTRIMQGLMKFSTWLAPIVTSSASGSIQKGVGLTEGDELEDMILLHELWVRPSRQFPKGRYVVVAGDQTVRKGDNPYGGELPYVRLTGDPQPGSPYSGSVASQIRPIQMAVNRLVSQQIQQINLNGKPQWLLPKQAQVDLADVNDRAGGIIPYNGAMGFKPERLPAPYLGSFWSEEINFLLQQMDEISGLRKASRGLNPEGVRSAAALTALQDADEEGRAPLQERFQDAMTDAFRLVMKISKQYISEDRLVRVVGTDGNATVTEFRRSDVERCYDVRVAVDSGLPKSPSGRLAAVLGMIEKGLLNPMADPKDKRLALRMLEFGELSAVLDGDEAPERERIHAQNLALLDGSPPVAVKSYDRHEEHAEGHARFMRSREAQVQFANDPEAEARCQAHLDKHLDWLQVGGQPEVPTSPETLGGGESASPSSPADAGVPGMAGGGVPASPMGGSMGLDLTGGMPQL
jgi:hypothetical protein